jgi:3-deoxy-D-manno-octulosonate 8-phosphate phosphatase (KDO 8-P phosphatase)
MIEEKAVKIRLFFLDVDGVMTDGHISLNEEGVEETKTFDVKDGLGLEMLISGGVEVVVVTGRSSRVVETRAKYLGVNEIYQGVVDKGAICKRLIKEKGFERQEVCCVGDDLPDLAMFAEAGLCIAVADAVQEVREASDFVTSNKGGSGAVREICELLLKCQGKWDNAVSVFTGK